MALSMKNPIMCDDIEHIKMLKEVKVYLLTGEDNDRIVIKIDALTASHLKGSSPAIKAIDARAGYKILTTVERQELKKFVDLYEDFTAALTPLGVQYRPDEAAAIKELKNALTFEEPFIKMEAQAVKDLEGMLKDRLAGNKADLRSFTAALCAPGGLEQLGAIVAADLFNGNTDRFFPDRIGTRQIGTYSFNTRCLVNVGNVFSVLNGRVTEVGALDFVDPNSQFKDFSISLAQAEAAKKIKWPGRLLADKSKRHAFAKDIAHDLEKLLHPKKSAFSFKTKLPADAASRLERGMIAGARKIKMKLEMKYNPNRWTAGMRERYQILNTVI